MDRKLATTVVITGTVGHSLAGLLGSLHTNKIPVHFLWYPFLYLLFLKKVLSELNNTDVVQKHRFHVAFLLVAF